MIAAFGDALGLLVAGDPALWDVIFRSLWVSTLAAVLAMAAAIPLGVVLGTRSFRGRWMINTVISSFQAIPAGGVGLLVYPGSRGRGCWVSCGCCSPRGPF